MNWKLVLRWLNWILWAFFILVMVGVVVTFVSYHIISGADLTEVDVAIYVTWIIIALIFPVCYLIYQIVDRIRLNKKVNKLEGKYVKITDKQLSDATGAEIWKVRPVIRKWKSGILIEKDNIIHYSDKFIKSFLPLLEQDQNLSNLTKTVYENMKMSFSKADLSQIIEAMKEKGLIRKKVLKLLKQLGNA